MLGVCGALSLVLKRGVSEKMSVVCRVSFDFSLLKKFWNCCCSQPFQRADLFVYMMPRTYEHQKSVSFPPIGAFGTDSASVG